MTADDIIEAACNYARTVEGDGYQKLLAELGARKAISLLTGQDGMFDPAFLPKGEVRFFQLADPVIADDADWYPTFEEMGAYLRQIAGPGSKVSAVKDKEDWRVDFPFNLSLEICWVDRQTVTRSELKEILRRQVEIYFQGEGKACAGQSGEVDDLKMDQVECFIRMAVAPGCTVTRITEADWPYWSEGSVGWRVEFDYPRRALTIRFQPSRTYTLESIKADLASALSVQVS